jgi:hypothetical protein
MLFQGRRRSGRRQGEARVLYFEAKKAVSQSFGGKRACHPAPGE